MKQKISSSELCLNMDESYIDIAEHIFNLRFKDKPDYAFIHSKLKNIINLFDK